MCSGIFRCSHLQRSYRASGKSSVCVQEPVRNIEAGWEVSIDHAQSGECPFFLDAHLSWSFRLVSGPGLSGPHHCIAENRSSFEPSVKLLLMSLTRHSPKFAIRLFFPPAKDEFVSWVRQYEQVK